MSPKKKFIHNRNSTSQKINIHVLSSNLYALFKIFQMFHSVFTSLSKFHNKIMYCIWLSCLLSNFLAGKHPLSLIAITALKVTGIHPVGCPFHIFIMRQKLCFILLTASHQLGTWCWPILTLVMLIQSWKLSFLT